MEQAIDIEKLKFPIGPFIKQDQYSNGELNELISTIESAPEKYKKVALKLNKADLEKTYRPSSWNVQQLFHHVADIQLLHFLRMKKALTERNYKDVTLIEIDKWANTLDAVSAPIEDSLIMFEGTTKRFVYLLRALTEEQLKIEYFHPIRKFNINQAQAIAMSVWHVRHHLEHIKIAIGNN